MTPIFFFQCTSLFNPHQVTSFVKNWNLDELGWFYFFRAGSWRERGRGRGDESFFRWVGGMIFIFSVGRCWGHRFFFSFSHNAREKSEREKKFEKEQSEKTRKKRGKCERFVRLSNYARKKIIECIWQLRVKSRGYLFNCYIKSKSNSIFAQFATER